jgi:hypothetical protein
VANPVLERSRERLVSALKWLLAHPGTPAELANEVRLLTATLGSIEPLVPTIASMRPLAVGMMTIFNNHERAGDNDAAYQAAKTRGDQLQILNDKVLAGLRDAPFPFEHAGGNVKLGAYLIDGIAHSDGMVLTLLRADAILERIYGVYGRAIGRLAAIAIEAELGMAAQTSTVVMPSGGNSGNGQVAHDAVSTGSL